MRRARARLTTVTVAVTAAVVVSLSGAPARAGDRPREEPIAVRVGEPLRMSDGITAPPVTPQIIGANARWVDDELGAWDRDAGRAAPGFAEAARGAQLELVRFPGGTVANLYDFTEAVGPVNERGCQTSGGFAAPRFAPIAPERNAFGPDEQERLMEEVGAETMVMVPSINRTASDAADYVEYMNTPSDGGATNPGGGVDWAEVRARNGHPAPYAIRVWEYGNEPYLDGQRYWRDLDPAVRARQFVEGGWSRQSAGGNYADDDGLFAGCDLLSRRAGSGEPGQSYRTRYAPLALPADASAESGPIPEPVLTVDDVAWTRVDDLATADADDTVYSVEQAHGLVRFGDGVHGAVPTAGARLAIEYTTGRHDGFLDYQRAMEAVDPEIEVCAGYARPEFIQAMGSRPYDCLGVHSYTFPVGGDADGPFTPDELYDGLMAASAEPTAELATLRQQLAEHFPDPAERPELAVTEYGTIDGPSPEGAPLPADYTATLAHNLYTSSLLVGQIENGVSLSISSNLNNGPAAPGGRRDWSQLLASPPGFLVNGRAQALSLGTAMIGGQPREVELRGNPDVGSTGYPALRATATCTGDALRLLVVNRDRTRRAPISLEAPGAARSATVTSVTAQDASAFNTDVEMPVRTTTEEGAVRGRHVSADLPARSTSLVDVRLQSGRGC